MRARVMSAVEELGYQPNAIARGLITQRSNMIAVVIANLSYYPEVLVSLSRSLDIHGLNMLLFSVDDPTRSAPASRTSPATSLR